MVEYEAAAGLTLFFECIRVRKETRPYLMFYGVILFKSHRCYIHSICKHCESYIYIYTQRGIEFVVLYFNGCLSLGASSRGGVEIFENDVKQQNRYWAGGPVRRARGGSRVHFSGHLYTVILYTIDLKASGLAFLLFLSSATITCECLSQGCCFCFFTELPSKGIVFIVFSKAQPSKV